MSHVKCMLKPRCATTTYLLECLNIGRLTIPSVGEDVEQLEPQSPGKTIWPFLNVLNIYLPHGPDVVFLSVYLREMKAHVHIEICT